MENASHMRATAMSPAAHRSDRRQGSAPLLAVALSSAQSLRALLGLNLAPLGLGSGHDRLLIPLHDGGRMSVTQLAEVLNGRPSTVSKMMDRLAERGLTVRSADGGDARRTNVELTKEGEAVVRELEILCRTIETDLHSGFTDDESQRMVECLNLLDDAIGQRLRRLR